VRMSLAAKTLLLALAVAGAHAYGEVRSASHRFRRVSRSLVRECSPSAQILTS